MARINQELIERISGKLNINRRRVYQLIEEIFAQTLLERNLAALVLATRHDINISRYSTKEEREQIRGKNIPGGEPAAAQPSSSRPPARRGRERAAKRAPKPQSNSVFVVHGRDEKLRKSMFEFLRALGLKPMEWSHAVQTARGLNPNIGDILNSAMAKVRAVVVLFSPDDLAYLKEQFCSKDEKRTEGKPQGQARPNVLFEAGLALGTHPEKTLLVQVGKVRSFSDIAGKHLVHLTNDTAKRNDVANRLKKIIPDVDRVGSDWMTAGNLVPTEPPKKKGS